MNQQIKSVRPFIGSKDFDISRSFYRDLGFEEFVISPQMSVFKHGPNAFYLQRYYAKEWVENTMIFFEIEDTEAFYEWLKHLGLEQKYVGVKLVPLRKETWGQECMIIDPAGVLLHFGHFYDLT